jgi:hypothetical protein
VQQDVLRLDVAMDYLVAVRIIQRVSKLGGYPHRLVYAELCLTTQLVPQRLTVDERHDVVEESVRLAGVEQGKDVRVLEIRGGLDFLHEALGSEHRGKLGPQHLHGHLAVVLEIPRQIDRRHAALANVALDLVAAGDSGGQTLGDLGHDLPTPRPGRPCAAPVPETS